MIRKLIVLLALLLPPAAPVAASLPVPEARAVNLPVQIEVLRLREALRREFPDAIRPETAGDARWIALARAEAEAASMTVDRPQLLVVVDRNPRVQQMRIILAAPGEEWQVVGGSRVSTGQKGRFDHYITPLGVFRLTDAILGYRAEGTVNENGIRGLGTKGMRVWDFGWHVAMKGWAEQAGKPDRTPIRLMLHATDPNKLEGRLGRPASQGCVRIPAGMNRFLDRHGVLDSENERAAATDLRFRALLLPDRNPTPVAGNTLVVVDSSGRQGAVEVAAAPTPRIVTTPGRSPPQPAGR